MAVTVRFLEDAGVIEMVFAGVTPLDEIYAAMTEAGALGAEKLTNRYLIDSRGTAGGGSAFDVLSLAEFLTSLPRDVIEREAILLPADAVAAEGMEFFETAARNRGLDVRIFDDREQAVAWLAE